MTSPLYDQYLTDGRVDHRKVRKIALLRARHDRDIDVLIAAGVKSPGHVLLSEILIWRRRAARPLMMAGARAGDTSTHTGRLYHQHYMNALEWAHIAARNVAHARG